MKSHTILSFSRSFNPIIVMVYHSAVQKNEIIPFVATWMDLEIIIISKVSQREKNKYHTISLICGIIFKMVQMNLVTKWKQTPRH